MKKQLFLFAIPLFIMLFGLEAQAQYKTAVGLRLGYWPGITVKHNINQAGAIEGILESKWRGFILTGLYEHHWEIFDVENLRLYLGGGAHVGAWTERG